MEVDTTLMDVPHPEETATVDKIVAWLEGRITAQQGQAERALRDGDASAHHRRIVKAVVLADVVRGLREGAWKG